MIPIKRILLTQIFISYFAFADISDDTIRRWILAGNTHQLELHRAEITAELDHFVMAGLAHQMGNLTDAALSNLVEILFHSQTGLNLSQLRAHVNHFRGTDGQRITIEPRSLQMVTEQIDLIRQEAREARTRQAAETAVRGPRIALLAGGSPRTMAAVGWDSGGVDAPSGGAADAGTGGGTGGSPGIGKSRKSPGGGDLKKHEARRHRIKEALRLRTQDSGSSFRWAWKGIGGGALMAAIYQLMPTFNGEKNYSEDAGEEENTLYIQLGTFPGEELEMPHAELQSIANFIGRSTPEAAHRAKKAIEATNDLLGLIGVPDAIEGNTLAGICLSRYNLLLDFKHAHLAYEKWVSHAPKYLRGETFSHYLRQVKTAYENYLRLMRKQIATDILAADAKDCQSLPTDFLTVYQEVIGFPKFVMGYPMN